MACVAFPTCGLAMAEAERYYRPLSDKLEPDYRRSRIERKRNCHPHVRAAQRLCTPMLRQKLHLSVKRLGNTICTQCASFTGIG